MTAIFENAITESIKKQEKKNKQQKHNFKDSKILSVLCILIGKITWKATV